MKVKSFKNLLDTIRITITDNIHKNEIEVDC